MVTNRPGGTLYIGVTSNLQHRIWQHRTHAATGFTDRYNLERLVWFELHSDMSVAIQREKSLKRWRRSWKVALIQKTNPGWRDLWSDIAAA
ncbi:GIY-YIG nuclease family protein [uncultured Roseobacter sp.]|uniref:GIY-YIG nuclease family protein n=1 Tax=uncultured Roseobacter sp. TaxID=114847 RepID=UPI002638B50C|nr:GIY-YIG nuclease family protein [uncultured Roseobacter sp.]